MEPVVFNLQDRFSYAGEEVKALSLRPIKAKDIRSFPVGSSMSFGDILDLAGTLSASPRGLINELSARDSIALIGIVSNFLSPGEVST